MVRKLRSAWVVCLVASCSSNDSDDAPPVVVSVTPADGAADVWLHDPIGVTFSESIAPDSVTASTVVVAAEDGTVLPATLALDATGTALTVRVADEAALIGGLQLTLTAGIT